MGSITKMTVSLLFSILLTLFWLQLVVCIRHPRESANNTIEVGYSSDLVTNLPGQPNVSFKHYAGYVTVDEKNGRALFYWFFEATSEPEQKPLVLWLNGGPGCSSVGYGATQEIGPFFVDNDDGTLSLNQYSWNQEANMLFVESPVGVGFSYSNTSSDYNILTDDFTATDSYEFLQKWFLKFPSYRKKPFYIAGESYAGKYVPELAEVILDNNNKKNLQDPSLHIDLRGILIGNPETSDPDDSRGFADYAWSHAVISDETHKIIKESCDFDSKDPLSNDKCDKAVDEMWRQYAEIDIYSLYTSKCIPNKTVSDSTSTQVSRRSTKIMPRLMGGYDPCLDSYAQEFYNRPDVQSALHVSHAMSQIKKWSICNYTILDNWKDSKPSVLPIHKKLIKAGLRIWVYSGDTDGRVPVLSTRYSFNTLGLPVKAPWRPWYHDQQVSGWCQEYEGLTFATFRGAGHAVPTFKPSNSLALFSSFLRGDSLPPDRYTNI